MKITILDHEYSYEIVEDELQGKWGQSNAKEGWIKISAKCPVDQRHSTLIHEVVHITADLLDAGLSEHENKVSAIAVGLYSFIKNNPEAVRKMGKK